MGQPGLTLVAPVGEQQQKSGHVCHWSVHPAVLLSLPVTSQTGLSLVAKVGQQKCHAMQQGAAMPLPGIAAAVAVAVAAVAVYGTPRVRQIAGELPQQKPVPCLLLGQTVQTPRLEAQLLTAVLEHRRQRHCSGTQLGMLLTLAAAASWVTEGSDL